MGHKNDGLPFTPMTKDEEITYLRRQLEEARGRLDWKYSIYKCSEGCRIIWKEDRNGAISSNEVPFFAHEIGVSEDELHGALRLATEGGSDG